MWSLFDPDGFDPFESHFYGFDEAVCIELHAVDAGLAVPHGGRAQRAAVVDDVVFVPAGDPYHRVVAGSGGDFGVLLEDFADTFERPERGVGDGVGHAVIGTAPAAFAPHEIVFAAALEHKRSFDVVFRRYGLVRLAVVERHDAQQVVRQFDHVAMVPAAVIHVMRTVVVAENELVDGLCAVDDAVDQRFAQRILVRAARTVGHGDADAAVFVVVLDVVAAEEEVVFAFVFEYRRRPHGVLHPFHGVGGEDFRMFGPVHEVLRREGVHVGLDVVQLVDCRAFLGGVGRHLLARCGIEVRKGRENPVLLAEDGAFGVGVPARKDGISRKAFTCVFCAAARCRKQQGGNGGNQFQILCHQCIEFIVCRGGCAES